MNLAAAPAELGQGSSRGAPHPSLKARTAELPETLLNTGNVDYPTMPGEQIPARPLAQTEAEPSETLPFNEEAQPAPPGEGPSLNRPAAPEPEADPTVNPETAPSADPGPASSPSGRIVNLTLPDLLNLTLQGNRALRNDILSRIVERQELNAAEQAFDPRFTPELRVDLTRNLSASGTSEIIDTNEGLQLFGDATDTDEQALLRTALTTRQGTDISVWVDPLDDTSPFQFDVNQPLLRGFGQAVNQAPVEQARLQESQNRLALRNTTIDTMTTAITRYTNLIRAQSQVTIQEQALERRQQGLTVEQALVEAGRAARADLFDIERSVADAQRDLADAQNQLLQANNDILNLIGTDQNLIFVASAETVAQLFENAEARAATYNQEQLIALALERRPDYRQAQLQRQQLELDQLLARDDLRWQLDARARGNLGDFSETTVGLVATRTFDDPQLETNQVRSEVALQQQDNTLAQLGEEIRNNVIAALESVRANLRRVQSAEQATLNARQQLDAARTQFRLGRGEITQFQLLEQEDQLVQAQNQQLVAEVDFLNAVAQLEQTVGITMESWANQVNLAPVLSEIEDDPAPASEPSLEE